ncbi:AlpA family transcriptional regulator [uncultured Sphingomonas sp.]|uniref:helix-turn-helix transcriptional regulator n=1 Tax=uncultured Sphingomonas sp. TaxID=158754 RepID=UPI002601B526|nr:AlpA family transcriptional regulator [uncultured Sphingomonas sp.]
MTTDDRLIRLPEVLLRTGLSRTTIWRRAGRGTFPAAIRIGENAAAWYESELLAWMADPMGWRATDCKINQRACSRPIVPPLG